MNKRIEQLSKRPRPIVSGIKNLLVLLSLLAAVSCQDVGPVVAQPAFLGFGRGIQEGEVRVEDGDEVRVGFPKPYQSPPRVVIVEFRESQFVEKPYSKSNLAIIKLEPTYFKIRNNHPEQGRGCFATIKWRAEGVLAAQQPTGGLASIPAGQDSETSQEAIIAAVKRMKGTTTVDTRLPKNPIVSVDLHQTRVTDADLEPLQILKDLRLLNLYGAHISDAGLRYVGLLTSLQTLYLNDTPITDAGLQQLQLLTKLQELGLSDTRVTDTGLPYLKSLVNLHDLALSGPQITDRGLMQLKDVKNLKHLLLKRTSVTAAGVQELRKALPMIQITFAPKY